MSLCYKTISSCCSCAYVEILSTWEVWRALKRLELHSAAPRATLTPLSGSPNFPRAQYLDIRTLMHELIVKYKMAEPTQDRNTNFDKQNQCEGSEDLSFETNETDQPSCDNSGPAVRIVLNQHLNTESTTKSGSTDDRRSEANCAKNVIIPRYFQVVLVVAVHVTLLVCVTLLTISLLTKMPQNTSDATKEGKV